MIPQPSSTQQHIDALSRLVLLGYSNDFSVPNQNLEKVSPEFEYVAKLSDDERSEFLRLADLHHVTVRALQILEKSTAALTNERIREWAKNVLLKERSRINHAVKSLAPVCDSLEAAGA